MVSVLRQDLSCLFEHESVFGSIQMTHPFNAISRAEKQNVRSIILKKIRKQKLSWKQDMSKDLSLALCLTFKVFIEITFYLIC